MLDGQDIFVGTLQNIAANVLTALGKRGWTRAVQIKARSKQLKQTAAQEPLKQEKKEAPRAFQTFHVKSGLKEILRMTEKPTVHLLIEDKPSTAWHQSRLGCGITGNSSMVHVAKRRNGF